MHKPLTTIPQASAHFGHEGTRKPAKSCLHNWLRTQLFAPRKSILQTNKLLVTARSKTKAEGATLPPVHGVQKHLDPAVKPEHDNPVADQNRPRGPTSADARPKVLLRPKLPVSQLAKKKLIDRSIKLLNKPKPQVNAPKKLPQLRNQRPMDQKEANIPNQRPVAQIGTLQRQ